MNPFLYQSAYHNQDLSARKFLITGGAGFIGSNIVEYLLKNNAGLVRVLDNLSNGYFENIKEFINHPNFEWMEGDIRDLETCKKAVQGMDYVSHQAALGSVPRSIKDPITSNEVNIGGFLNMLVASRDANVKRFVYAASSSTYGDSKILPKVEHQIGKPLSPYAITKYVNELYADVFAKTYGFETIGLRYFNVFGPKQSPNGAYAAVIPLFVNAIRTGQQATINGDGEQTRDFTFVENAVQANIKGMLCENPEAMNQVYNIAFGERVTLNELWKIINEFSSTSVEIKYGPDRAGDVRDSLANIDKARQLIGYEPKFSVKDGLQLLLQTLNDQQQGAAD